MSVLADIYGWLNFWQTLEAFEIKKSHTTAYHPEGDVMVERLNKSFEIKRSHTTAYHPEGDGMVERLNKSLLQLLRTYIQRQDDWEKHLPLVLYAYQIATHSLTGTSPFLLLYGRQSISSTFSSFTDYDVLQYQETL